MSTTPRGVHEGWQPSSYLIERLWSHPLCSPSEWLPVRVATGYAMLFPLHLSDAKICRGLIMAFLAHRQPFTWVTGALVFWASTRPSDSRRCRMPVMDALRDNEPMPRVQSEKCAGEKVGLWATPPPSDVTHRPSCSTRYLKITTKRPRCARELSSRGQNTAVQCG